MTNQTPEHLLAEFKLATGKGQLIRANEMAAKLFALLIEADQKAAASACDPAQCPCRAPAWTPIAGPEHGLVTRPETTAAPVAPASIAECITPSGYIELSNDPVPLGDGPVEHPLWGTIPEAIAPINSDTLEFIEESPAPKSRKKK